MARKKKQPVVIELSLETALDDAFSEVENLADEMRSWYDNMPENLQQGDKGCRVDEAASALENVQRLELPECLNSERKISVGRIDGRKTSRAARLSEAVNLLELVKADAEQFVHDELEEGDEDNEADEVNSFVNELQQAIDELEGVEFPGMFG